MKSLSPPLKYFIVAFASFSLAVALFNKLAVSLFSGLSLTDIFAVSSSFLNKYFLWQPLTYFFIEPSYDGLSFGFLLNVFFNAYLLTIIGSSLIEQLGKKTFIKQMVYSGLIPGLIGFILIKLFGLKSLVIGPQPLIYSLLIIWLSFNPIAELFVFIALKLRAKLIIFALIGISLLSALSEGRFLDFFVYFSGILVGYLSATVVYGVKSPFNFMHSIDKNLIYLGKRLRKILSKGRSEAIRGKIIDIRSIKD